jgi:hypothetical protein
MWRLSSNLRQNNGTKKPSRFPGRVSEKLYAIRTCR